MTLTQASCPVCRRDLERGERERYACLGCGRQWVRIGLTYEPDDPVPVARVVAGAQTCCSTNLESAGWEKFRCTTCGKRYVRVGIELVPE